MATLKTRLARIEAQIAPEIPSDVCDTKLVELTRQILGQDFPIESIPCGISGKKVLDMVLKDMQEHCSTLPVIVDDAPKSGMKGGQYGYV
ncbi:MAG: hypothetical protein DID91_2727704366 [Candidatus Nitrotoga sp. MKT]|nr:MAG: hypothetical protein DID91_2727704366 [Candidatus Nitrotoga sp. MKT]